MNLHATYENNELIVLLKKRDQDAFKFLYDKYSPALYSVILQIVRNKETADEVVQEVFIIIWQKMESYNPAKERLFTWLLKMARYVAVGEMDTTDSGRRSGESRTSGISPVSYQPETDECGLRKLINNLEEENMMLIDLCYFKNFSHDMVAEALNIPAETVNIKIKNALSELRTLLT